MLRRSLHLLKRSKARLLPMGKKRQSRLAVHRVQIRLQNGCIRRRHLPPVDRRRQSDLLTAVELPSREQKIREKKGKWPPTRYQPNTKLIDIRRGEGGEERRGGPLWSPASYCLCSPVGKRHHTPAPGDHKGPLFPTPPPSPLRRLMLMLRRSGSIRSSIACVFRQHSPLWSPVVLSLSIPRLCRASHIFLMKTPGPLARGSKHAPAS